MKGACRGQGRALVPRGRGGIPGRRAAETTCQRPPPTAMSWNANTDAVLTRVYYSAAWTCAAGAASLLL